VLAHLTGEPVVSRTAAGWVAMDGPDPEDRVDTAAQSFTVRLGRAARTRANDVSSTALAELLRDGAKVDGARLAALVPPFAAAHRDGPSAPVVAATDWLGFRQLFWWRGPGISAVSTSALALRALAGAGLDRPSLALQSLVGWQVGVRTLFTGVEKVPAGCLAVLEDGRIELHRYVEQSLAVDGPVPSIETAAAEQAELMTEFHTAYLRDHPGTVLQLTGGQDTRVLLAAIPHRLRAGLPALTLDVHGGVDSRFANRLSDLCGLRLHVHRMDEGPAVSPADAHALAVRAARALDCMASPLALAPLLRAESHLEQGHRLSGLGGETCRGFYYFGQPRNAVTAPRLIEKLATWRLYANEAVETQALAPDFAASARADALELITASFDGAPAEWLAATDHFYLYQRMQRWSGAHGSVAAASRHFINPMFDRRFVQLAHAVRPEDKRGGLLTGRLITLLDPALAAVPLDSGLIPRRLGRPGLAARTAAARVTARKAAGKIRQRLYGTGRPQLGAAEMADLVVRHWRAEPEVAAPLRGTGLVRDGWLDELLAGRTAPAPATVAFLINLLALSGAE
jgi:asparagine synthase (glutamine-hydrolysing)